MAYIIKVDKKKCIGCGACEVVCDNFKMGEDGKAHVKKSKVTDLGCNEKAADICGYNAIILKKE